MAFEFIDPGTIQKLRDEASYRQACHTMLTAMAEATNSGEYQMAWPIAISGWQAEKLSEQLMLLGYVCGDTHVKWDKPYADFREVEGLEDIGSASDRKTRTDGANQRTLDHIKARIEAAVSADPNIEKVFFPSTFFNETVVNVLYHNGFEIVQSMTPETEYDEEKKEATVFLPKSA